MVLILKYVCIAMGILLFVLACIIPGVDLWLVHHHKQKLAPGAQSSEKTCRSRETI
jgi:hypothetical protein